MNALSVRSGDISLFLLKFRDIVYVSHCIRISDSIGNNGRYAKV